MMTVVANNSIGLNDVILKSHTFVSSHAYLNSKVTSGDCIVQAGVTALKCNLSVVPKFFGCIGVQMPAPPEFFHIADCSKLTVSFEGCNPVVKVSLRVVPRLVRLFSAVRLGFGMASDIQKINNINNRKIENA